MAVTREVEPWSALLEAGRADARLVRQAYEGARRPISWASPTTCTRSWARRWPAPASTGCTPHQAQAYELAAEGPFVVTTGTASGKSLCFNLPALDTLLRDARARALYLYPTKALAQDQARAHDRAAADQGRAPRHLRRRHARASQRSGDPQASRT